MNAEFLAAQQQAGAIFASDTEAALHFGNPQREYKFVGDACALFDRSDLSQIEITGDDRVKFLHNFCTNDIKRLGPGEGCEAFATNVKGRVLAHLLVFAGENSLWVDMAGACSDALFGHLDRYIITEDVTLHSRSSEVCHLLVSGPTSGDQLAACGLDAGGLGLHSHRKAECGGIPVSVCRVDLLGPSGYLLKVAPDRLADLWSTLTGAGIPPAGRTAYDVLRIEAGLPAYGSDITDENLAQEVARTNRAISFTKGCYLGQEPIARLDAMGHVNRILRGIRLEQDGPAPPPGTAILAADEDRQIGQVTSSAQLDAETPSVALGYVRSGQMAPGTQVRIGEANRSADATIFWPDGLE
jgi:hypothetical protein